jgi:hydrogenase expression/formation protein HypC
MEGVLYDAALAVVDDIHVGDYVIVHAGFVLEKLDEQEAAQELDAVRRYASGRVHTP